MAEQTLKEKTARGLFWGMLNNGTMQVLNLVIGIFLGRLLTPADYGIVGVLAIFTAIAGDLQSAGFTQALINMAVATGVMPVTGQPLPLVSRGGSSIMVNCFYIGLMLNISRTELKNSPQRALEGRKS